MVICDFDQGFLGGLLAFNDIVGCGLFKYDFFWKFYHLKCIQMIDIVRESI